MGGFDYIRPVSVEQALEQLDRSPAEITILAGGTDIIPGIRQNSRRFKNIRVLLDIHHLTELKKIYVQGEYLHIGAAADFSRIAGDPLVQGCVPLLADAAGLIGSVQIRNRASIGGNIVNNAPCADSIAPLLVYEAQVRLCSSKAQRDIQLSDFLRGSYQTIRRKDELVTELILPIPEKEYRGEFRKLGRRRGVAVSRISLAVLATHDSGRISDLRISSGAITPIGIRFYEIEQFARNKIISPDLLKEIAVMAGRKILDVTGLRWSGLYKLPVVQQLLYQVLYNVLDMKK